MVMTTLKESYNQKRKELLKEKLQKRDKVIAENLKEFLLLERVEPADIKVISQIVKQLKSSSTNKLPSVARAVEEVNKDLLGAFGGGILQKVKNFLTPEFAKPLTKALGFLSGLKNGLNQLDTIVQTIIPAEAMDNKDLTMDDIITGLHGTRQGTSGRDVQNLKRKFVDAVAEAMRPEQGFEGIFGANVPYINKKEFAADLLKLTATDVEELTRIGSSITLPAESKEDVEEIIKTVQEPEEASKQAEKTNGQPIGKKRIKTKDNFVRDFNKLNSQQQRDAETVYKTFLA